MTVVLLAVYAPIAFQGGLTGALFIEFAFTLVGTIIISTIVALTLSPMMCAKLLKPHEDQGTGIQARIVRFIDRRFDRLHGFYSRRLHGVLNYRPVVYAFCVIVVLGTAGLYMMKQSELAPQEDLGFIFGFGIGSPTATTQQYEQFSKAVYDDLKEQPQHRCHFPGRLDGAADQVLRLEALGRARPEFGAGAAGGTGQADAVSRVQQFLRRPAAAPAEHVRGADAVRHQHDRILRPAERSRPGVHGGSEHERPFLLRRHGSEDRPAASDGRDRPRQGCGAGPFDERRRQRALRHARRRLRQLFRHGRTFLPGDGAGRPAVPAQSRAGAELLHPRAQRQPGAALDHRAPSRSGRRRNRWPISSSSIPPRSIWRPGSA